LEQAELLALRLWLLLALVPEGEEFPSNLSLILEAVAIWVSFLPVRLS
jgi:hypothetical protein